MSSSETFISQTHFPPLGTSTLKSSITRLCRKSVCGRGTEIVQQQQRERFLPGFRGQRRLQSALERPSHHAAWHTERLQSDLRCASAPAFLAPTHLGLSTGAFGLPPQFQKRDLNTESEWRARSTEPHTPVPFTLLLAKGLEKDPLKYTIVLFDIALLGLAGVQVCPLSFLLSLLSSS